MTEIARIAVVGRPNVGKSTLTNRIARSRVSIVEPTAGVTRDRVFVRARIPTHFGERWIEVIDTGGVGIVTRYEGAERARVREGTDATPAKNDSEIMAQPTFEMSGTSVQPSGPVMVGVNWPRAK